MENPFSEIFRCSCVQSNKRESEAESDGKINCDNNAILLTACLPIALIWHYYFIVKSDPTYWYSSPIIISKSIKITTELIIFWWRFWTFSIEYVGLIFEGAFCLFKDSSGLETLGKDWRLASRGMNRWFWYWSEYQPSRIFRHWHFRGLSWEHCWSFWALVWNYCYQRTPCL